MEPIIGLEPGTVRVLPYQPEWARLFEEEHDRLEAAVGDFVLELEHIGSTSVPGLPAKPIIDIGIAVRDFEAAFVCVAPIEALGYVYRGENGIPRRHYFRKGYPLRTHHIHMVEVESTEWAQQILFRDYLRGHPGARRQYADLKIDLARRFPKDRDAYLAAKAPLIREILALARQEKENNPS
jgi:GrpB-like predicted nucleotidyltransferase (UPF0157 family)